MTTQNQEKQESQISSRLYGKYLDHNQQMREATRLAAKGKYKCRTCGKIDDQDKGVIIAFASNVLLGVCPDCITGPIILRRDGNQITVQMEKPSMGRIVAASNFDRPSGLVVAKPTVKKVSL